MAETTIKYYKGAINVPKLLDDLTKLLNKENIQFDAYKYYLSTTPGALDYFTYNDNEGNYIDVRFADNSFLNEKINYLEMTLYYSIDFVKDFGSYRFQYSINFHYINTSAFKSLATNTEYSRTDFRMNDAHLALELVLYNVDHFFALLKKLKGSNFDLSGIKNKFLDYFSYKYEQLNTEQKIDFYRKIPYWGLEKIDDEKLYKDLEILIQYDKGKLYIDGWVNNSSDSILKLIAGFKNKIALYSLFKKNPELVMKIYSYIDLNARIYFAKLMEAIILLMRHTDPNYKFKQVAKFIINENTSVDANITESSKPAIYLKNVEKKTETTVYNPNPYQSNELVQTIETKLSEGYFHPFDYIAIDYIIDGKPITIYQTALLLKAHADTNEWLDILYEAQLISTIAGTIITIATAGTTTPLLAIVAFLTDILITGGAYGISNLRESLAEDADGKELIEQQNKVILAIDLVNLGISIYPLLKIGTKILRAKVLPVHALLEVENIMDDAVLKALKLQDETITACKVLLETSEDYILLSSRFNKLDFQNLIESNITFVKQIKTIDGKLVENFAGVYKGVRLKEGSLEDLYKYFNPLSKKPNSQLVKDLDILIKDILENELKLKKIVDALNMWNDFEYKHLIEIPPTKKPCFLAGTLIKTEKGLIPIEQIQVNDCVYAFNFESQKSELKSVSELFVSSCDKYIEISTTNDIIKATGGHRFWIPKLNKWIKARELTMGMKFQDADGNEVEILVLNIIEQKEKTYNFEVEDLHNYYVGKVQVLSHNKSIEESIFASTNIVEVEFYKHFIGDKILYIGQTTQGIGRRFEQHMADYKKYPKKKPWMKNNPDQGYLRLDPNDPTKVKFKMTHYEAAVVELYEINTNGGIRKGNIGLFNKSKPIGKRKFDYFKEHGNFNPCLFYV